MKFYACNSNIKNASTINFTPQNLVGLRSRLPPQLPKTHKINPILLRSKKLAGFYKPKKSLNCELYKFLLLLAFLYRQNKSILIPPIREFIYRLTDKFLNRCPTHPNPLISSIGNYPLADLHCQYKKYLHKRPKHILL